MGGGTDVALEAADAALLKSRVIDVPHLASLSRATMANIHQNMTLALGLKGLVQVPRVMGITDQWGAVLVDTGAPIERAQAASSQGFWPGTVVQQR